MRIRYLISIEGDLILSDHWEIPFQKGKCKIVEKDGKAQFLEITFKSQPVTYAPSLQELSCATANFSIVSRDPLIAGVIKQLSEAASFLQCFHNINFKTNEVEAKYEAETPEEEKYIPIKSLGSSDYKPPLHLTFDMVTRSIMAAEKSNGPKFETKLVSSARSAFFEHQYINSFRYSFLLIEALFGEGQFKSASLKNALKNNTQFITCINAALDDSRLTLKTDHSDTEKLILSRPSTEDVIDHLVEKRGFYFHGNINRKDAWKPQEQEKVATLAHLALNIVLHITKDASSLMFDETLSKRHFDYAEKAGAIIVFQINYKYREPEERFQRDGVLNIKIPGTKITPKTAFYAAKGFLENFEYNLPVASLHSAECIDQKSGKRVFEIIFNVD